jgi:PAS domain S-box-containing protein
MGGHGMTKDDLTRELAELRRRIAELESLEETCRSSEINLREMYRRVVEDLPDLICRYKPDTTITFVNEAYAKYFDKTVGELVGTSFLELIPPEDHEYVIKGISSFTKETSVITMEHKVRTPDGQERWQLWRDRAIFDGSGNITEIQSIGQDITERKLAEEELMRAKDTAEEEKAKSEAIIACMGEAVSIQDKDFRVIYQNDIHKRLVGGDKEGQYCYKAYANSNAVCDGCAMDMAFKDGGVHSLEKSIYAEGRALHIEIVASPLRNSRGEIVAGIEMVRDITGRKEAEKKQKETYSQLETLIESIPYAVYFKDARGRHVVVNKACCEFLGLAKEKILGKTCEELMPPKTATSCRLSDNRVFEGRKTVRVEDQFAGKDGNNIYTETIKTPLYDEYGNVEGLVGMSRDITERKMAEEELKYRNLLLSTQQETSLDGILVVDENGKWVSFNRRFVKMWGIPDEILESKRDEDSLRWVLDKLADPDGFIARVKHLYEHTDETSSEQIELNDGRTFDRYSAPVSSPSGEYFGRVWYFRDITRRRKTEEVFKGYQEHLQEMVGERTAELTERTAELTAAIELLQEQISERTRGEKFIKNILESIDEWLLVIGRDYRIISANRAFCESMEMPFEGLVGKPCYELLHDRQSPCFEGGEDCSVRKVFMTGEPSTAAHTHNHSGSSLYVETKTYPMRDDEGNIGSVIQIIHNVSEKRKLEDQLRHSQKMEAIGQLAGGVAHDFNNRLAAIMNYAFILKTNMSPDNPLLVHVNQIMNSSERAAHLTQNLLTFSRKHVINPRPVKLNDVVEGIEKLLARVIGEDIELETELSEDELVVMADSGQIEHVLINLATNARDSVHSSGRVSISTSRVSLGPEFFEGRSSARAGHYALISFMDTGGGMNVETKGKIFEPFFTTKGVGKGTGLGLSIVYGIVKQHGGHITVESEPGVGTAFYIYLPLLPVRAEQAEPEVAAELTGGSETVLLVEDDEDVRKPLRQMLEGFGYDVIEAVNGKDAIEKFLQSRKSIGLLVLDVILPGLNGIEVLRAIRKVQPGIRAIFTSGYSKEHVWSKGLPMPGTAFLSKPVAPEVLLEKVREALDG